MQVDSSFTVSSFLLSTIQLIGRPEVMLQPGPLHYVDGFTKLIVKRCALVVESCRRTTHCIFPSVRGESKVLSTVVAMDLLVALLTTSTPVIGSGTRFGTLSICSALMLSRLVPMLGSSVTSLTQTPRDAPSCGFVPSGVSPRRARSPWDICWHCWHDYFSFDALFDFAFYAIMVFDVFGWPCSFWVACSFL